MRVVKLSEGTKKVLKEILIESEGRRSRIRGDCSQSDYSYRVMEADIASRLGFEHRIEWCNEGFLGFQPSL